MTKVNMWDTDLDPRKLNKAAPMLLEVCKTFVATAKEGVVSDPEYVERVEKLIKEIEGKQ